MSGFSFTLNVPIRSESARDLRSRILDVLRQAYAEQGYVEAGEDQDTDRMAYVIAHQGEPWVAIYDDLAQRDGNAGGDLAVAISRLIGRPVVGEIVVESAPNGYFLFDNGRLADEVTTAEQGGAGEPQVRAAAWAAIIDADPQALGALLQPRPDRDRVMRMAELLHFGSDRWQVLAGEDLKEDFPHAGVLRLRAEAKVPPKPAFVTFRGYDPSVLAIPDFLYGMRADVRRRWRRAARKALKAGGWSKLMDQTEFIPLNQLRCRVLLGPAWNGVQRKNVIIGEFLMTLEDVCAPKQTAPDRHDVWYARMKPLLLTGMDMFWFCFASLADSPWRIRCLPAYQAEKSSLAPLLLEKLLKWWPQFCSIDHAFCGIDPSNPAPWPGWCRLAWHWSMDAGIPEDEIAKIETMGCVEAGEHLRRMLDNVQRQ